MKDTERICKRCGKSFVPITNQRYCRECIPLRMVEYRAKYFSKGYSAFEKLKRTLKKEVNNETTS